MKFLVKATKDRLDEMEKDLEAEKQKALRIQASGRWKWANRLVSMGGMGGGLLFMVDYERKKPKELLIFVTAAVSGFINQKAVEKVVMDRAKGYGHKGDVDIRVVP
jgi:hypothetical protein